MFLWLRSELEVRTHERCNIYLSFNVFIIEVGSGSQNTWTLQHIYLLICFYNWGRKWKSEDMNLATPFTIEVVSGVINAYISLHALTCSCMRLHALARIIDKARFRTIDYVTELCHMYSKSCDKVRWRCLLFQLLSYQ